MLFSDAVMFFMSSIAGILILYICFFFSKDVPELSKIIGEQLVEKFIASDESSVECNLKFCFTSLMTASKTLVKSQLDVLLLRVQKMC